MQLENILDTKQLALLRLVALNTLEVASLSTGVVPNCHLLLLVYLASVDELFQRTCSQEAIDGDVAGLAVSVRSVHGLQVMRGIWRDVRIEGLNKCSLNTYSSWDLQVTRQWPWIAKVK